MNTCKGDKSCLRHTECHWDELTDNWYCVIFQLMVAIKQESGGMAYSVLVEWLLEDTQDRATAFPFSDPDQ